MMLIQTKMAKNKIGKQEEFIIEDSCLDTNVSDHLQSCCFTSYCGCSLLLHAVTELLLHLLLLGVLVTRKQMMLIQTKMAKNKIGKQEEFIIEDSCLDTNVSDHLQSCCFTSYCGCSLLLHAVTELLLHLLLLGVLVTRKQIMLIQSKDGKNGLKHRKNS